MRLGYQCKFDAAHKLGNSEMSSIWNEATYGKCCNLHGHTWRVDIEVEGTPDKESGMVVNFTELKRMVHEFDHKLINDFIALPTAENLVTYFVNKLKDKQIFSVVKVRVYESEHAFAEDIWITR